MKYFFQEQNVLSSWGNSQQGVPGGMDAMVRSIGNRTTQSSEIQNVIAWLIARKAVLFTCCMKTYRLIFYKTWKIPGPCMETFCRVTMKPSLFGKKLKTIPLLRRSDHFVFTRKFLKQLPCVNTISQIAR